MGVSGQALCVLMVCRCAALCAPNCGRVRAWVGLGAVTVTVMTVMNKPIQQTLYVTFEQAEIIERKWRSI